MNINAKAVLSYLQQKAEETGTPNYGCEKDELQYFVKVDGVDITPSQVENAISGDQGLRELRLIYTLKDDPKIYLSSRVNGIDPDCDGSTLEQRKQWFGSSFVKFFSTEKDRSGIEHTLAVVKAPGTEEARIVVPVLEDTGDGAEYTVDGGSDVIKEIGCIRYMTDTRHPYTLDEGMPVVLAGTNLKAPNRKTKFSSSWQLPEELKECGISYWKILQRATSAAIDHVSHSDGMKVHLNLAVAYTATVAMFKDRAFKSESTMEDGRAVEVSKVAGDMQAMVFINGEHVGTSYWKPCGSRGLYKGHVKLIKVVKDSDSVKEFCSLLLEAGSVRKIKPLNEKKKAPENRPFENLELPKAADEEKPEKAKKKTTTKKVVKTSKKVKISDAVSV
jgi:hypothetical protein